MASHSLGTELINYLFNEQKKKKRTKINLPKMNAKFYFTNRRRWTRVEFHRSNRNDVTRPSCTQTNNLYFSKFSFFFFF